MDSHDETGCQAPEGPILCVNNCGFFGSAATMNMCSKCHKAMIMKQQQAELAASSIESIVNGGKEPTITSSLHVLPPNPPPQVAPPHSVPSNEPQPKDKEGPSRCTTCRKRVGLTGFRCKCGDLFCGVHRYSEMHNCQFDYRTAGREAIASANPVVRAEKLDKI